MGDFSARLAQELARGDVEVTIHSRTPAQPNPQAPEIPVVGHPDAGPMSLARSICRSVLADPPDALIVQYTPQMWDTWRFGSRAVPWLVNRVRKAGVPVFLIAHELYLPVSRRIDLTVASLLLRLQLGALLLSCDRVMVTTETRLASLLPFCRVLGLPVPGVVRVGANALPLARGSGRDGVRVGVFSWAALGKRVDVLLDAFTHIARARPDARLVLIGDPGPPDSLHTRLALEAVRQHAASDRIRITGRLGLDAVAREIRDLDVYLFTMETGANTRSSTLPTALGTGIPVVAVKRWETDSSVFRDRENILYARDLAGPDLAAAVLEILGDPELAAQLSQGAKTLYEQYLAWPKIAEQLLVHIGMG